MPTYVPVASFKHGRPLAVDYTNPSTTVTVNAGQGVDLGTGHVGFAVGDIAPSALGALYVGPGVFTIQKDASTFAQGDAVYFNTTNQQVTSTSSGNILIGYAESAAATGATTVDVVVAVD